MKILDFCSLGKRTKGILRYQRYLDISNLPFIQIRNKKFYFFDKNSLLIEPFTSLQRFLLFPLKKIFYLMQHNLTSKILTTLSMLADTWKKNTGKAKGSHSPPSTSPITCNVAASVSSDDYVKIGIITDFTETIDRAKFYTNILNKWV